ncbi:MAG: replication-associated recombination protein A [Catenulispora sp.]
MEQLDLFEDAGAEHARGSAPLAVRMRPRSLEEIVGQKHLLRSGSPLWRLVKDSDGVTVPSSILLWGPPGTGKTTLAYVLANATDRTFAELSAINAGVKEVRAVVERAKRELGMYGRETLLFLDEIHRFSKAQQDSLLPAVENRWVTLVAATTENPHFSIISPLLSRSLLLTLQPLTDDDVREVVHRAVADDRGLAGKVVLPADSEAHLLRIAGGDARRALTALEAGAAGALAAARKKGDEPATLTLEILEQAVDRAAVRYDRDGDQHYDVASAFIKSVRGSDVDAALHYLARMVEAGEDPRFIARRLVISASEDIGMADPGSLQVAVAAMQAVSFIGWPEAQITLAHAVIHLALAPKSNSAVKAIGAALDDIRKGLAGPVPPHLRDAHYSGAQSLGHGQGYLYAHDVPGGVAAQQYAPDAVQGHQYYHPTRHGAEARYSDVYDRVRALLAGDPPETD